MPTTVPASVTSLESLVAFLTAHRQEIRDESLDVTSLPTFGGEEPADTLNVYSWDAERLLVDANGEWEIVPRPDVVAVEFLRAVRLPNGTYAYQADEVNRWVYGVTESDMGKLGRALLRCPERPEEFHETKGFAYSSWAQETSSGEVLEDTGDARHAEIEAAR